MAHRAHHVEGDQPAPSGWRRHLSRIAYAKEYVLLVGLFITVVAGLLVVIYGGVAVLSAVRAYTHAEALYSKAQKDAVYYLSQYAASGDEQVFEKYKEAIAVPLGYRQARVELETPDPDPEVVRAGLIQGRMHPDDATIGPVWAFRLMRRVGPATQAFRLWTEADMLVTQLEALADLIHVEVAAGNDERTQVASMLQEVERLNVNLTTLEGAFSSTLGAAARWVRRFVLWSVGIAALSLLLLGLVPSWRMLKRLKDSEEKFRRLFEQSRDAIMFITPGGTVAYANPAAYALFGHDPGKKDPWGDRPMKQAFASKRERQHLAKALREHGFIRGAEVELCRADGTRIEALITAMVILDRRGKPVGYESIIRDISDRKRTERRMRLLERAVEASGNVILISDATHPDFPLVYVNPAFERMTGYTAEEAIGQDGFFLLSADQKTSENTREELRQALGEAAERRIVLRNQRKDGRPFWNELSFAPVYDDDGQIINYVGIQTDVTEIKEAEEALKKALAREKELSEIQARFVSMASHEFRTPMATILSSAELVERFRHRWNDEQTLKHLRRIQSSVQSMTKLLENVLLIGKAEAGRLFFCAEEMDLTQFSRELVEEIWIGLGEQRRIKVTLPQQALMAQADSELIRSLLSNLLTNAAKYSSSNSLVSFSLKKEGERAIFCIEDEGIGIPEADLQHVASPFHRAANAETIPGTGLGLSIAHRAVDLHGGTLRIYSTEGEGTRVVVTLPLHVNRPAKAVALTSVKES
jgi:PAS domain S-box-containing protein